MHLGSKTARALAVAALFAIAGSAQAQEPGSAEARATMSNFQIQVIDLDLNDDIASAVTFDDDTMAFGTSTIALTNLGSPTPDVDAGPLFTARSSLAQVGFTQAITSTSAGNPFVSSMGPGASGYAKAVGLGSYAAGFGNVVGGQFTLTANTRLVFSADASGVGVSVGKPSDFADAYAQVLLAGLTGAGPSSFEKSYASFSQGVFSSNGLTHISAQIDNHSDSALVGWASAQVAAQAGVSDPSLIPEPATQWLAMLGVLAVGAFVQRQNRS